MGKHNYNFYRLFIIDDLLRTRSGATMQQLREKCEMELYGSDTKNKPSIRTTQRDVKLLIDEFDAKIIRKQFRGIEYLRYKKTSFTFLTPFSKSDLALFRLSITKFRHLKETRLISRMENVLSKIEKNINVNTSENQNEILQSVQFETPHSIDGLQHLNTILDAIRDKKVISFKYNRFHPGPEKKFTVHPYLLREHEKWWYLIGKCGKYILHFGLDRIRENITITDEEFIIDKGFNPEEHFKYSFGITVTNEPPVDFILSFEWVTGQYVKSKPLHHTQEIISEDPGKEFVIHFKCYLSHELRRKILSYGHEVKVIQPLELKNELIERYKKALKQYS